MRVSSDQALAEELIGILGSKNVADVRASIRNNAIFWISIFRVFVKCDCSYLKEVKHTHSESTYRYVTLKFALELMSNFDANSNAYGSRRKQLIRYKQLLSSLSFLDSDLFSSFILKRFKYTVIEELLGEIDGNGST